MVEGEYVSLSTIVCWLLISECQVYNDLLFFSIPLVILFSSSPGLSIVEIRDGRHHGFGLFVAVWKIEAETIISKSNSLREHFVGFLVFHVVCNMGEVG